MCVLLFLLLWQYLSFLLQLSYELQVNKDRLQSWPFYSMWGMCSSCMQWWNSSWTKAGGAILVSLSIVCPCCCTNACQPRRPSNSCVQCTCASCHCTLKKNSMEGHQGSHLHQDCSTAWNFCHKWNSMIVHHYVVMLSIVRCVSLVIVSCY